MEQTVVMACLPLPLPALPAAEAPASRPGDAPFVMLHVLRFASEGEARLAEDGAAAGTAGLAAGARPAAWFRVEGTVVGDGRRWDEVRFNRFPSRAAFEALRSEPVHQGAQAARSAALADTFAVMVRPMVDRIAESAAASLAEGHSARR